MPAISGEWLEALKGEFGKEYYKKLFATVQQEYQTRQIFPPADDVFNAFHLTPLKDVKVVIFGQDPYHGERQAHGLCFSVKPEVEIPPSLVNIYKELHDDLGCTIPSHGYLEKWAKQGVLLLNAVLTVRESEPTSHSKIGWETFTDRVISELNKKETPVVFLLWGAYAQKKAEIITNPIHQKLMSVHPSPLSASRGFFGCKHFSKTNELLVSSGLEPINW